VRDLFWDHPKRSLSLCSPSPCLASGHCQRSHRIRGQRSMMIDRTGRASSCGMSPALPERMAAAARSDDTSRNLSQSRWSWRVGKLLGIPIRIHVTLALVFGWIAISCSIAPRDDVGAGPCRRRVRDHHLARAGSRSGRPKARPEHARDRSPHSFSDQRRPRAVQPSSRIPDGRRRVLRAVLAMRLGRQRATDITAPTHHPRRRPIAAIRVAPNERLDHIFFRLAHSPGEDRLKRGACPNCLALDRSARGSARPRFQHVRKMTSALQPSGSHSVIALTCLFETVALALALHRAATGGQQ
jgi:hypothetical protein